MFIKYKSFLLYSIFCFTTFVFLSLNLIPTNIPRLCTWESCDIAITFWRGMYKFVWTIPTFEFCCLHKYISCHVLTHEKSRKSFSSEDVKVGNSLSTNLESYMAAPKFKLKRCNFRKKLSKRIRFNRFKFKSWKLSFNQFGELHECYKI